MEKYLHHCLDSLLIEKINFLEVIVVNDGSKDSSSNIAHEYASKYPNTFRVVDKENGNYGSCINRGLKEAKGKYIKVLDADDRYNTANLDLLLNTLSNIDVDLLVSDYIEEFDNGNLKRKISYSFPSEEIFDFNYFRYKDNFKKIAMHSVAYKTEILRSINYVQTEGVSYTDYEWIFAPMSMVKKVYYAPITIYRYLLGREGQTMVPSIYYGKVYDRMVGAEKMIVIYKQITMLSINNDNLQYLYDKLYSRLSNIYFACLIVNRDDKHLLAFDKSLSEKIPDTHIKLGDNGAFKFVPYKYIAQWRKNGKLPPIVFSKLFDLKSLAKKLLNK